MVGYCTFEQQEYRAAKRTYSAERFVWLTKLNNLRIIHNGNRRGLTDSERQSVIDLPYRLNKVTYKQLRAALEKAVGFPGPSEAGFAGLSYRVTEKKEKDPEEVALIELKGWHELRKAFDRANLESSWQRISQEPALLDEISSALTFLKTDEEIKERLSLSALTHAEIEALLAISFTDFIQLSLVALRRLIPHMEQGQRYDEACNLAGYKHYAPDEENRVAILPPLLYSDIRNPVVFRALNQARKVMNALIREYDSPIAVHIELARDLSKPFDERMEIKRGQEAFAKERASALKLFIDTYPGREPNARNQDLAKFRLYREQDGQCAYSQNPIDSERLLEIGYVEIDHILPYSRSFDDSQNNKTLVLTTENRNKGNRTPFEYLDGSSESNQWRNFEAWVRGHKGIRKAKRDRLLRRVFDEREARDFAERNLNDTRYATRFFSNFVRQNLKFALDAASDPVLCPSGSFTSFLRARWGLIKNREQSDLHHALDAAVVAAANRTLIKRVSDFSRKNELVQLPDGSFADRVTGEILDAQSAASLGARFPKPWDNFRDELIARLTPKPEQVITADQFPQYSAIDIQAIKPIWVSRAPKRRNNGAIHQETIRSKKFLSDGKSTKRAALKELKPSDLENIVGANDGRNDGLLAALRERFDKYGADGKKAFAEPLYKPLSDGSPGPLVRTVKVFSTQKGGFPVRGGIADQASMWRVDVFRKGDKIYLVPIYQSDRGKNKTLPNRAALAHKPRAEWTLIDSSFEFLFSLCMNDGVVLKQKTASFSGYFGGLDISTALISIYSHDRNVLTGKDGLSRGLGVKTAISFDKFHVDVLGRRFPAKSEIRRGLA